MEHKDGFMQLAALLLEKEVIFADDLERIFGPRPWGGTGDRIQDTEADQTGPETSEISDNEL